MPTSRSALSFLLVVSVLPLVGSPRCPKGPVSPRGRVVLGNEVTGQPTTQGRLPLRFEPNLGQSQDGVRFLARGAGYGLYLTSTESVLVLPPPQVRPQQKGMAPRTNELSAEPPAVLRLKLLGANRSPEVVGREELPGKSHYFLGNDPTRWRRNVPQYERVEYQEVYPGVDLAYYGNEGQLEYDFVVAPGADPRSIRLGIEGARQAELDEEGNLILATAGGALVKRAPVVYQDTSGGRREVSGRYTLRGDREVGFELGAYDETVPLVIDPVLLYSTYLGGSDGDGFGQGGIAVDAQDNAYVTGSTVSTDFPVTNPARPGNAGLRDAFVTKLDPAGTSLVYSTYLGGSGEDEAKAIAVDSSGNAYITGRTESDDFPTLNPAQPTMRGTGDAFVVKLDPGGSILYSTYLGGSDDSIAAPPEVATGIAVDAAGRAHVVGRTSSTDFPTVNPLQPSLKRRFDAFVSKLTPSGSALAYSTYLGFSAEWGLGVTGLALDPGGNVYVVGSTYEGGMPPVNALQPEHKGGTDAWVAKLNPAGTAFVYFTYLGGSNSDEGVSIAADSVGNAYVAGFTQSPDFPTAHPLQPTLHGFAGTGDAFVAKLSPSGDTLIFSTYLGGSGFESAKAIAADAFGNVYVAGHTTSGDFPTVNPLQADLRGTIDVFVAMLNPEGSRLVYSTYLGGSGGDWAGAWELDAAGAIAVDSAGNAYVTGRTESSDFPTVNPFQRSLGGPFDAFVVKLKPLLPTTSNPTLTEGDTGSIEASFTVSLSEAQQESVGLSFETSDGTAKAGKDYEATSGTATFPAGTTTVTISVPVLGDTLDEEDETFFLFVGGLRAAATILDDDPPPAIRIDDVSLAEGNQRSSVVFRVSLSEPSGLPVTVDVATEDATASAGSDYLAVAGTVSVAAGATVQTLTVTLLGDRIFESDETFLVRLSRPVNASLGRDQAVGTIVNDDAPGLSIQDTLVREGRAGVSDAVFTVTLSPPSAQQVTVDYTTADGTATAGQDYVAGSGTLTFPAGATTQTVGVPVVGDVLYEGNETFFVRLGNASGAPIVYGEGVGTIADDEERGDFDGDGQSDIFWRHPRALCLWLMQGGHVDRHVLYDTIAPNWSIAGSGDFAGDGRADLLWRDPSSGETYLWLMDGGAVTAAGFTSGLADSTWQIQGVADFDADGRSDILWRRPPGDLVAWLMDGTRIRESLILGRVEPSWQIQALGDFNADGWTDIFWRDQATGVSYVWLTRNGALLEGSDYTSLRADPTWRVEGVADFDGDGRSDLVWRHREGVLCVWRMDGVRVAGTLLFDPVAANWEVQGTGDFNADGFADILWRDALTGRTYVWAMDGAAPIPAQSGYTDWFADRAWSVEDPRW